MIFWRLRDLGLGRRGRGRLDAAAAGAGRDRRRAASCTLRGGTAAGRAGMPSSGHRRPPWRRAATAIGGAAMVMGAAGGAVRQRRCEPRGRRSRAQAVGCAAACSRSARARVRRRSRTQARPAVAADRSPPLPPCQPVGSCRRRASLQAVGIQRAPCCAGADSAAAILPASRTCPARPGGCGPQLYSRHAVSLPTAIKGQVRFRLKHNQ